MNEGGFSRTIEQIRIKWKHLQVAYRKVRDHNGVSGNSKITCPFFNELDEVLHDRPNANKLKNGTDSSEVDQKCEEGELTILTFFNQDFDTFFISYCYCSLGLHFKVLAQ